MHIRIQPLLDPVTKLEVTIVLCDGHLHLTQLMQGGGVSALRRAHERVALTAEAAAGPAGEEDQRPAGLARGSGQAFFALEPRPPLDRVNGTR